MDELALWIDNECNIKDSIGHKLWNFRNHLSNKINIELLTYFTKKFCFLSRYFRDDLIVYTKVFFASTKAPPSNSTFRD